MGESVKGFELKSKPKNRKETEKMGTSVKQKTLPPLLSPLSLDCPTICYCNIYLFFLIAFIMYFSIKPTAFFQGTAQHDNAIY